MNKLKKSSKSILKVAIVSVCAVVLVLIGTTIYNNHQNEWRSSFEPTGNAWQSPKRIEDYFIDSLKMTPEEARMANNGVSFYVTQNTTLDAIISNLTYYGLVRDANSLKYALEHTKDSTPGKDGSIKVGGNGTIDLGYYELSRQMDTWQIADTLLNKPNYRGVDPYNYLFMPGDPNAPHGERPQE